MTTPKLRPASDWEAHFGVKILDPDGWRRNDGVTWETPIDASDFHERYNVSTVQHLVAKKLPVPVDTREETLRGMQAEVREVNEANGWFESDRTFGEDVALLHSEVSEMLEAYRDWGLEDQTADLPEGWLDGAAGPPKPEGVGSEAADILIRLLDTVDRRKIDLAWEFERKLAYNRTRGNRHGGKRL